MDFPNKPLRPVAKPIEQPDISVNFESVMPLPPLPPVEITAVNPNNPPWNSFSAIAVWLMSVLLLFALQLAVIAVYLIVRKIDFREAGAMQELLKNDTTVILLSILSVIPAHLLTLLVAWAIVTKFGKQPFFATLGWRWGKNFGFWSALVTCLLLYAVGIAVTSYFGEQETEMMRMLKSSRNVVYVTAFLATFTAPLVEEVVYRGVLYSAFQRSVGKIGGIALVTFLFALVHVPQYYESLPVLFIILLLSLVLTSIRAWTGNLLPCFVIHTIFNGIQAVLMVIYPDSLTPEKQVTGFFHLISLWQ